MLIVRNQLDIGHGHFDESIRPITFYVGILEYDGWNASSNLLWFNIAIAYTVIIDIFPGPLRLFDFFDVREGWQDVRPHYTLIHIHIVTFMLVHMCVRDPLKGMRISKPTFVII